MTIFDGSKFRIGSVATLALALALTAVASLSAWSSLGRVFPSFLFDPTGSYSLVDMPHWANDGLALSRTSRIAGVGDRDVGREVGYAAFPGNRISALLDSAARRGSTVVLRIEEGTGTRRLVCGLHRFGPIEILLLCVVYLAFGWFALLATFLLREGAGHSGRELGLLRLSAVLGFAFLAGFLDFHTNGWLYPFFQVANIGIPLVVLLLCFEHPFPVVAWRPAELFARWILGAYFAFAVFDQVARPLAGFPAVLEPDAVDIATKTAFLLSGTLIIARAVRGRRGERSSFVLVGMSSGAVILLLGAAVSASLAFRLDLLGFAVNVLLPLVPTCFVLCFGYAALRHNTLEVRSILARKAFRIPALFLAAAAGCLTYTLACFWSGHTPAIRILDAWLLLSLFGGFYALIGRGVDRFVFRAAASYREVVSDLGDFMADVRSEEAIARALRESVARLLPYHQTEIVISVGSTSPPACPPKATAFPMVAHGKVLGLILLGRGVRSPILTDEDANLLRMVAAVGAIGISNARNLASLESGHRKDIQLTRDGSLLSLQVFGAEVAHEMRYPISFFRFLLRELEAGRPLEGNDIRMGSDEVERMETMVVAMGGFRHPRVASRQVGLAETARRAGALLKDVIERQGVAPEIRVPDDILLRCDGGLLVQLLANLLKNAIEAAQPPKSVVLEVGPGPEGGIDLVVRDSGAGLPDADIFSPWVSTKEAGRGIGLAVCHRVCREFGWEIDAFREEAATCFQVRIPRESVVRGEGVPA